MVVWVKETYVIFVSIGLPFRGHLRVDILKCCSFFNWVRYRISFLDTNHDESFLLSISAMSYLN